MLGYLIFIAGVAACIYFYQRDRRQFDFPEEPGVYRVKTNPLQAEYSLFAYFDGIHWCKACLSHSEAINCFTRSDRGYYWAPCKQV